MTAQRRSPLLRMAILLCGILLYQGNGYANVFACNAGAGGIGGTGVTANGGGIGGTGAAAHGSGIGGTGIVVAGGGIGGTGQLAGTVLFSVGLVEAQSQGQSRALVKGAQVCAGDILQTGKAARVQLNMADGGTILLRPNSRLVIETFVYDGVEDGTERSELVLLEGGMRTITGAVGKRHKDAYGIRTPNARISIRGTDHETIYVPASPFGQPAPIAPGTYNRVISGATVLQTGKGAVLLGPNQTGFAGMYGVAPVMLDKPTPLFGNSATRPNNSGKQASLEKHTEKWALENSHEHDFGIAAGTNELVEPIKLGDGELELHNGLKGSTAESSSFMVGAQAGSRILAVGGVQASSPGSSLLINEQRLPFAVSNDATRFNFLANNAPLVDSGDEDLGEVDVHWGVYAGGVSFDSTGKAVAVDFHHFVYAKSGATPPEVISAMTGAASFSSIFGYTKPSDEMGGVGGNIGLNVNVRLGANAAVTSYNIKVTDAHARNWSGTFSGDVPLGDFAQNGLNLIVSCTGASCGSGIGTGSAVGILVGPKANGLISAYGLSTTTGQNVVGTAVLSR